MKRSYLFVWRTWRGEELTLFLHDKYEAEAYRLARQWGWRPPRWWRLINRYQVLLA